MVHRNCSIEIYNGSNTYTLANPQVFTESGVCEVPPPPMLGPCSSGSAYFTKTTGAATGAVGVITYDLVNPQIGDFSHVLAVMFSVPFDRLMYSNWLGVGMLERGGYCDYDLYDRMYNGEERGFVRAKADGSSISYQGGYLVTRASMSECHDAVLRVDINDAGYVQGPVFNQGPMFVQGPMFNQGQGYMY